MVQDNKIGENDTNSLQISLSALIRILFDLFPEETLEVSSCKTVESHIIIEINHALERDNQGMLLYDLSNQLAFGIPNSWMALFELSKAILSDNTDKIVNKRRMKELDLMEEQQWKEYATLIDEEEQDEKTRDLPIREREYV